MQLAELGPDALARRLANGGLPFRIGPFVIALHTAMPELVEQLSLLYGEFPALSDPAVAHYHMTINPLPRFGRRATRARVVVEGQAPFVPGPREHAMAMFESMLNYCVVGTGQQHFILHAAVVERNGRAILLPAPSGSGKSTLCAALVGAGWRLLSDEFAILTAGARSLLPMPRPISLKNVSINLVRSRCPGAVFSPAYEGTIKGTVVLMKPPADAVARMAEPAEPVAIVLPQYRGDSDLIQQQCSKPLGFIRLMSAAVNYRTLGSYGFDIMAALVDRCPVHEIIYPDTDAAIALIEALHRKATGP